MIQNDEKTFLDLPTELLHKILRKVPLHTVASAAQVCKTWNAEEEPLWQANFKRHFSDEYKDLQQKNKEITNWKNAFCNEETIQYKKLTPLQQKLLRLIKR